MTWSKSLNIMWKSTLNLLLNWCELKQAQSLDHASKMYNFDQSKPVEKQMKNLIELESMKVMWNDDSEKKKNKESDELLKTSDSSSVF